MGGGSRGAATIASCGSSRRGAESVGGPAFPTPGSGPPEDGVRRVGMARASYDEDPGSSMIRSRPLSFLAVETSPKTLLLAVEAAAQGQQGVALFHGLRWIGGLLLANAAAVAGRVGKSTRGLPRRAVSAASGRALTA